MMAVMRGGIQFYALQGSQRTPCSASKPTR